MKPEHGSSARAANSVREIAREPRSTERVFSTLHDNGTEVQHTPCDETVIALMYAWKKQDVLRDGQDGVAFA